MNKFNCADIHPTRRLRYQQEFRWQPKFAANNQLLFIPARQCARRQSSIWRTHIEVAYHLLGTPLNPLFVEQNAGEGNRRLPIMNAENSVLSQAKIQKQTTPVSI